LLIINQKQIKDTWTGFIWMYPSSCSRRSWSFTPTQVFASPSIFSGCTL